LGAFFGQTTLASAWAALGPGPLRWRLPLSLVWVALLPLVLVINIAIHHPGEGEIAMVIVGVGGCLLGQWLVVQLPLWTLALGYGLRLRHVDDAEDRHDQRERQFGIRHLMVITAIVGVIFGVGRIVVSWQGESFRPESDVLVFVFLGAAAIALTLPLLLAGLLPRRAVLAVLVVLGLIGVATVWELTLLHAVPGAPPGGPGFGDLIGINAFTAATILAAVAVVRLNGYGVQRGRRRTEA
jgi:hypothetical protein